MKISISVRQLVQWAHAPPASSGRSLYQLQAAQLGQHWHQVWQQRRLRERRDYRAEIPLSLSWSGQGVTLEISGRADGVWPTAEVEEIKTSHTWPPPQREQDWAQLEVYAALLALPAAWSRVTLHLTHIHARQGHVHRRRRVLEFDVLWQRLVGYAEHLLQALIQWREHVARRDRVIRDIGLPFGQLRPAQRDFAEALYRALRYQYPLLAEAATGVGKTYGALVPLLQHLARNGSSAVYFTARNSVKAVVRTALEQWLGDAPVRVLVLHSRLHACPRAAECALARCPETTTSAWQAARDRALGSARWEESDWEHWAVGVCPYQLRRAMVPFADIVIADQAHLIDSPGPGLGVFDRLWAPAVWLFDEVHHLASRAASAQGAEIALCPPGLAWGQLSVAGQRWRTQVIRLQNTLQTAFVEADQPALWDALEALLAAVLKRLASTSSEAQTPTQTPDASAAQNLRLFDEPDAPLPESEALVEWGFAAMRLLASMRCAAHTACIDLPRLEEGVLSVNILDPEPYLQDKWPQAIGLIGYSATLRPWDHHIAPLGWDGARHYVAPEVYRPEQLRLRWVSDIDLRYSERDGNLSIVIEGIRRCIAAGGNTLIYVPSYAMLHPLRTGLEEHLGTRLCCQTTEPTPDKLSAFLAPFRERRDCVGLAVLGSQWSEGIDLPGEQLMRVIVVTLGLGQFDAWQVRQQEYWDQRSGDGYERVVVVPALRKTIQAAGRLLRSSEDRGELVLIDQRWGRYRRDMPRFWHWEAEQWRQGVSTRGVSTPGVS